MRGFKEYDAADRFCREHDELRNFLRSRSRHNPTNTFQPPADAVTSSITLASRSASCRPHDQNNSRRAHSGVNGARRDRTHRSHLRRQGGLWRRPAAELPGLRLADRGRQAGRTGECRTVTYCMVESGICHENNVAGSGGSSSRGLLELEDDCIAEPFQPALEVGCSTTAEWIARQITEAFPWDEAPRYLIRDRDTAYGVAVTCRLRAMGIRDRPISPRSPWQNGHVERLIGSIRRECLDHVVALGEGHVRHLLANYQAYYNSARTHLALDKDAPLHRPPQTVGRIASIPWLGGLHRQYTRMA